MGYLTPEQLAAGLGQLPGGAYHREPDDGSLPRDPDAYCPGCHEYDDADCRCTAEEHAARRVTIDLAVPFEHADPAREVTYQSKEKR